MSLEAFGVKNLRCLTDTGLVPIRPITVLVGRNSSGKSTFLRAFPLLRQSVETARNSPILWYHERYVDFGSLKTAANDRLDEPSVTFMFRVRLPADVVGVLDISGFDVEMTLAGGEVPHVSAYSLRADGHDIRWCFDALGQARSLTQDGRAVELVSLFSLCGNTGLVPSVGPGEHLHVKYEEGHWGDFDKSLAVTLDPMGVLRSALSSTSARGIAEATAIVLGATDLALSYFMDRVAYLRPLRVSPERAYRIQNLAVDEVDPDGKNLPMFLRSLSRAETESFAAFTQQALGFETSVRSTELHAEILVKEGKAKRFVNLIDVGFGYAEVLPLAAILWATCIRPGMQGRSPAPLVAIEQPELHLHPAHQAKLARTLVRLASLTRSRKLVHPRQSHGPCGPPPSGARV